jgi:DNA processing protein
MKKQYLDKNENLLAVARWVALSTALELTPSALLKLYRHFGASAEIYSAKPKQLHEAGLSAAALTKVKKLLDEISGQLSDFETQNITAIPIESADYPQALLDLRSPPVVLYLSGNLLPKDRRAIAIVGTRTPSLEGRQVARELAHQAVSKGFCVVSGLARGIDTEAHRAALLAGGRTIAVLGNGLMYVYPAENKPLAARISRHGSLMSELWPTAHVSRHALLARDRLQAALSLAVIVIQTHTGCGSLTTAKYAISCRRPLFALKWEEEPYTIGLARLRDMGATIITEHDFDRIIHTIETEPTQQLFR